MSKKSCPICMYKWACNLGHTELYLFAHTKRLLYVQEVLSIFIQRENAIEIIEVFLDSLYILQIWSVLSQYLIYTYGAHIC